MCGRFVSTTDPQAILEQFDAERVVTELEPSYNVAPTNDVYVVYEDGGARLVDAFWWGLIPHWAKDTKIGSRMINARAETLAEKNSFKSSFNKRRCIIPVTGFYEWKKIEGSKKKQPYFISNPSGTPYPFGGLWSEWKGTIAGNDAIIRSTTIITTTPNDAMSELHHRMPLILPKKSWSQWLDHTVPSADVPSLLVPAENRLISYHPVSLDVNNARNKEPHLIEPAEPIEHDQTFL